jgi:hypothetical protein
MLDVDLHSHSTHSDGILLPAVLARRAFEQGVKLFALTDHDELSGLAEAREVCESLGVRFVSGVEISVTWGEETLHIVGLNINPQHPSIAAGLGLIRKGRRERAERIAEQLDKAGIEGTLAGAQRYASNPQLVSRAHFARFLVERGHAKNTQAVFKRYLIAGKPGFVEHQWASLAQAVNWIREAGGVSVIAHPGRYQLSPALRERLLAEFCDLGGTAIEVVTGSHTVDQYAIWGRHAKRFGLKASAGSDFHGPKESYLDIGRLPNLPEGLIPVWNSF